METGSVKEFFQVIQLWSDWIKIQSEVCLTPEPLFRIFYTTTVFRGGTQGDVPALGAWKGTRHACPAQCLSHGRLWYTFTEGLNKGVDNYCFNQLWCFKIISPYFWLALGQWKSQIQRRDLASRSEDTALRWCMRWEEVRNAPRVVTSLPAGLDTPCWATVCLKVHSHVAVNFLTGISTVLAQW